MATTPLWLELVRTAFNDAGFYRYAHGVNENLPVTGPFDRREDAARNLGDAFYRENARFHFVAPEALMEGPPYTRMDI